MPARTPDARFPVAIEGYDVVDEIGAGGFSVVYRARQTSMNRDVAIKVLNSGFSSEAERRTFERECHALGQLSHHPNIVTVFNDAFTTDGRPCIVMELYHSNYRDRLEREGVLPVDEAMAVAVRICGALHTAHEAGVLHRDLKPHNIFVSAYGEPALGDFGISTIDDERSQSRSSGLSIAYAAPEMLEDGSASVASDVYSTAATLYQLVAGATPFAGPDLATTVRRILTAEPPRIDRPGLPPGLNRVIRDALAKAPGERPASMTEFAEQLREVQRRAGLAPTPIPRLADDPSRGAAGTLQRPPDTSAPSFEAVGSAAVVERTPADATVARPRASRPAPVLRSGDEDPELDASRRRVRTWLGVGAAVLVAVAVVVGVVVAGGGGDEEPADVTTGTAAPRPTDDFFAVLQPPADLLVQQDGDGAFSVSYEMPDSATSVEVEVVSGGDVGERFEGAGEPLQIEASGGSLCVVARSLNDSGQQSTDAGPVCSD